MTNLRTNFQDDVFTGNRKYNMITNNDGTVSFVDVTTYQTEGSDFGAQEINEITRTVNQNISELNTAVTNKIVDHTVTLTASGWTASGSCYIQTKTGLTGVTSTSKIMYGLDDDALNLLEDMDSHISNFLDNGITISTQGNGSITFRATNLPDVAYVISLFAKN